MKTMNEEKPAAASLEALIRNIVGDAFELVGFTLFAVGLAYAFNNALPLIVMGLILAVIGNLGDV